MKLQLRWLALGTAVAFALLSVGNAPAQERERPSVRSGSEATRPAKTGNPVLESRLRQVSAAESAFGPAGAQAVAGSLGVELAAGRVRVVVHTRAAAIDKAAVQMLGGQIEATHDGLVQLSLPLERLDALAQLPEVGYVRLPIEIEPQGTATTEALAKINAPAWHDAGFTGDGVRVAVFDTGFQGYQALLGNELPDSVETHSCTAGGDLSGGGNPHGAAVAEIIHDIAPDAQLLLVNARTEVEFGECVDYLIGQDVDIVNFSAGSPIGGPGDGTGIYNDAVEDLTAAGVLWINSAGNYAQQHWAGTWLDVEEDDWLDFVADDNYNRIEALAGDEIRVAVRWDDVWGRSCNDYDLLLLDAEDGQVVAFSDSTQDYCDSKMPSIPLEGFSYTAPADGTYYLVIERFLAEGFSRFDVFSLNNFHACPDSMQYCVKTGSLAQPADNEEVLAVGAVPWHTPDQIEPYSSRGPTEDNRTKPELVAATGVSTSSLGDQDFGGTSASSPHVTGAAALLKQAQPAWDRTEMTDYLTSNAVPLGAPGQDNVFGYGRLLLGPPAGGETPTPTSGATATAPATATLSPTVEDTPAATATETETETELAPTGTPEAPTATPTRTVTSTRTPTPQPEVERGDGNCDTHVNSLDAALALQLTAGILEELFCNGNVDADNDGEVDAIDAALILQLDAGLISELPTGSAAGVSPSIQIGSLSQAVDQVGGVTLQARDMPVPGLGAWTIDVVYDTSVVQATSCSGLAEGVCNASYNGHTVRVVGATGSSGYSGDRDLASLNFRCVADGTSSLEIGIRLLVDGSGGDPQPIDAAVENGSIECGNASVHGDANCDGQVTVVDAQLILQFDAGIIDFLNCAAAADVDNDGEVSPVDASLILQYLVGLIDQL